MKINIIFFLGKTFLSNNLKNTKNSFFEKCCLSTFAKTCFKSNLPSTTEIFIDSQNKSHNHFNRFFLFNSQNLAKNISYSNSSTYQNYLKNRIFSSIFLSILSINEIINVIYFFNMNIVVGHDNVSAFFLHLAAATIARPICNVSLIFFVHKALFLTTVH